MPCFWLIKFIANQPSLYRTAHRECFPKGHLASASVFPLHPAPMFWSGTRKISPLRPTSRLIIHKCCVDLCGSLWIFVDILWIFVDLCGSLWIFVDTYLWIFVDIASSLIYMLVGLHCLEVTCTIANGFISTNNQQQILNKKLIIIRYGYPYGRVPQSGPFF